MALKFFIKHFLILFILLYIYSGDFSRFIWSLLHPGQILHNFYMQQGLLSKELTLTFSIANMIIGVIMISVIFGLSIGKNSYRIKFLKLLPFLYLFACVTMLINKEIVWSDTYNAIAAIVLSFLVVALFFYIIYRFYRSDKIVLALFGKNVPSSK